MKYILFLLFFCSSAFAGEFTVMGGMSVFRAPDSGTYWNANQEHDNFMTPASFALRYDTAKTDSYSFAVQYTHFGEVTINALAVSTDAPHPGGYDPATGLCVGPCAPLYRWKMRSDTQSVAFIATKHVGKFSMEVGLNVFEIKTAGNVPDISYQYPEARHLDVMPMAGVAYRDGPWSLHVQVWYMPAPGETPQAFHEGGQTSLLVGYTF